MRDLFDSIKDLKQLATNELDGRQRGLVLDAIWQVVKTEPGAVITELGQTAVTKWAQFKTAPIRSKFQSAKPSISLNTLRKTIVAAVTTAKDQITERGPINLVKDAAHSVTSALGSVNTVRTEIVDLVKSFGASEHKGAEAQKQVVAAVKVVGFAALILLDRVQRAEGPAKDGAAELVGGVSKILSLHPEVLALTAVAQLVTSVARRAMAHVPEDEAAHRFFDQGLKLYEQVSEMGLEYVLSLKIEGLEPNAEFVKVSDEDGRTLLHVPRAGEAEQRAFAAAWRMCGAGDAPSPGVDADGPDTTKSLS